MPVDYMYCRVSYNFYSGAGMQIAPRAWGCSETCKSLQVVAAPHYKSLALGVYET